MAAADRIPTMSPILAFLLFPAVGALVGWFTNWLAIRMLFRPRRPMRFLWWTLQGVIPSRHAELADRVADTVADSLLTRQDLEKALGGAQWKDEVDALLEKALHESGPGALLGKIPMLSAAWLNVIMPSLREVLGREIVRFISRNSRRIVDRLMTSVDVRAMVRERVERFEMEALENMVTSIASREFGHIQVVGAVTGAAIGVVQAMVMLVIG